MGETISFDLIARDLASKSFSDAGGAAEGFHGKLAALSGLATGVVGAALTGLGEHLESVQASLKTAVDDAGESMDGFSESVDKAVAHEEHFGHTNTDTETALAELVRATGSTKQAMDDMNLTTELASAHHESLAAAAETVAKMHAGSFKSLKEFGINVKDNAALVAEGTAAEKNAETAKAKLTDATGHLNDLLEIQHSKHTLTVADHIALTKAQEAVTDATRGNQEAVDRLTAAHDANAKKMDFAQAQTLLLQKIHGDAEAQADTFGGKVSALKAHFTDLAAELGTKVGPALTIAGPLLGGIGAVIEAGVIPAILGMTADFAVFAVEAVGAMLPFLPIIALVGFAAFELYEHWDQIWGGIKAAVDIAWQYLEPIFDVIVNVGLFYIRTMIAVLQKEWEIGWAVIHAAVTTAWAIMQPVVRFIVDVGVAAVRAAIAGLEQDWEIGWAVIHAAVTTAWAIMQPVVSFIVDVALFAVKTAINLLKIEWDIAWAVIHAAVTGAWTIMKPIVDFIVDNGVKVVKKEIHLLSDEWDIAWGVIHAAVTTAWTVIKPVVGFIVDNGLKVVKKEIDLLKSGWDDAWNGMSGIVSTVWGGISGVFKGGVNDLIAGINFFIRAIDAIQIHIPAVSVFGHDVTPAFNWNGLGIPELPELRAMGGPVVAGRPYIVGDGGVPELFIPEQNGRVLPSVPSSAPLHDQEQVPMPEMGEVVELLGRILTAMKRQTDQQLQLARTA